MWVWEEKEKEIDATKKSKRRQLPQLSQRHNEEVEAAKKERKNGRDDQYVAE